MDKLFHTSDPERGREEKAQEGDGAINPQAVDKTVDEFDGGLWSQVCLDFVGVDDVEPAWLQVDVVEIDEHHFDPRCWALGVAHGCIDQVSGNSQAGIDVSSAADQHSEVSATGEGVEHASQRAGRHVDQECPRTF